MSRSQARTREDGTIFQMRVGVNTAQVIVWERGRPARNAPQVRSILNCSKFIFALRAHLRAGRPLSQQSLEGSNTHKLA